MAEGHSVAMQKDKEPVIEVQLRAIGQGFGLQNAVVPLVTYVNVRIGILVPLGEVFFFSDATPFIGGPIAGAKGPSRPLCGTAVIRNDILLFSNLLLKQVFRFHVPSSFAGTVSRQPSIEPRARLAADV